MAYQVAPNALQRWIARHRSGVRGGIFTFLVLAAANWSWTLTNSDSGVGSRVSMGLLVVMSCSWFITLRSICRFVDNWDAKYPEPRVR